MKFNTMDNDCTIYIDEAGDLGIGRGTKWFVLTAVIVNTANEQQIRNEMSNIKRRFNLSSIHFRKLRNFEQKSFTVHALSNTQFEFVNIVIDTEKIIPEKLSAKKGEPEEPISVVLYNHACRYLLERVSWLLRDTGRVGKVVLSSRGTSRDGELIHYLADLISYPQNEITNCFSGICSKAAESWDMLQLADICATSMFYYHEINAYGFITPCYMYKLSNFLYKRNGLTDKYGVKYYTDNMKPDSNYFTDHMICK